VKAVDRDLYPFAPHYLDVDGLRLHYLDEGRGQPVLAVHGNPTWSFYYRSLVLGLRDGWRVVVPDHVGCGLSEAPDDARYPYTLGRRIDDLERLVDHLALEAVNLVVHDWGGPIGLGWAVRHPDRVARLVLLNTAAFRIPEGMRLPWQLRLVRDTPVGGLLVRGLNAFARGASRLACTRGLSKEVRDAYCAPYDDWGSRRAVLRFVQDIPVVPSDPAYGPLAATEEGLQRLADRPILVCWGGRDFVFDDAILQEWERIYPSAEVHRFEDAGHWVLEDAGEEIVPLVRRFLMSDAENEGGEGP